MSNDIKSQLSKIKAERANLQKEIEARKDRISRLAFAEKALRGFDNSVKSGKLESILRHFANG